MKEKFINLNCAQMAAVTMWMLFTSLNLTCILKSYKSARSIDLTIFADEGYKLVIPKGYCYTSKEITHFREDVTTPPFQTIRITFEYSRKEDKA